MKILKKPIIACLTPVVLTCIFFLASCSQIHNGSIIITRSGIQQPGNTSDSPVAEQLALINPDKPSEAPVVLTKDFFTARSPRVSYDGNNILFEGRKTQNDTWQIWEMNINGSHLVQITSSPDNCTNPLYLPGNRIVFSKASASNGPGTTQSLFTCKPDGSDIRQITFSPYSYASSTILKDGRILFISKQKPEESSSSLMALRPDGTKAELFYFGAKGTFQRGNAEETADNKIIFTESDSVSGNKTSLVSVNYNRPLHSRTVLSSGLSGDFKCALPWKDGKFLISYRESESGNYSLYEFDPQLKSIGKPLFENSGYDITGAVLAVASERPKKLPSEVDMGVKTGLLFCQDINIHNDQAFDGKMAFNSSKRIEIIGMDSVMGIVNTEEDGSFYLKVIADTPFKIRTLDEKGNVISGPCDWVWVRPNERRGCVGCHEDHEMVPDNRRPLSVIKDPVSVPVHINKVVEKKISLE